MPWYVGRVVGLVLLALCHWTVADGQELWDRKPYERWTGDEARKVLSSSPWVRTHTFSQAIIESLQTSGVSRPNPTNTSSSVMDIRVTDPAAREDVGRARQARPELKYVAQFRSALPIRQAIVRLGQISVKYDSFTEEQKKAFDRDTQAFLAKSFADTVIVYVSYSSNVAVDDRELALHWQSQTTDTLKNFVFLIRPNGEKVPILGYVVSQGAGREFQFVFPRSVDGRPLISPGDKTLQLEFPHPKIRDQKEGRVLMSFGVDKMLVNGAIVY